MLTLRFTDAGLSNPDGAIRSEGVFHYFRGNNPRYYYNNVPLYRQIIYRELWPGIDTVVQGRDTLSKSTGN